jgi:hypothetical protein
MSRCEKSEETLITGNMRVNLLPYNENGALRWQWKGYKLIVIGFFAASNTIGQYRYLSY